MNCLNKLKEVPRHIFWSVKILFNASPIYVVLSILDALVKGISSPVSLLITSVIFEKIEQKSTFYEVLCFLVGLALWHTFCAGWNLVWNRYFSPVFRRKISEQLKFQLFYKIQKVELAQYDNPEFYNDYLYAIRNNSSYIIESYLSFLKFLNKVVNFISIFSLFISLDLTITILIFAISILSMILNSKMRKIEFQWNEKQVPISHRLSYIDKVLLTNEYALQLRTSRLGSNLIDLFNSNMDCKLRLNLLFGSKEVKYRIINNFLKSLINVAIVAIAFLKLAVFKSIDVGDFSVVISACWQMRDCMMGISLALSECTKYFYISKKIKKVDDYMLDKIYTENKMDTFESIEFKNVSFGYNSNEPILENFNLEIKSGEKIALVGYNGAGKSTILNLLLGLYTPDSGAIIYNKNRLVSEIPPQEYRKIFGVVFQDYNIYSASVAENILCDTFSESLENDVISAIEHSVSSEFINQMPKGIHTTLTREFDESGMILSGGERQRIALARAFVRPYDIIVMDEPSAALDPLTEKLVNTNLVNYSNSRTLILVSHRLGITRYMDRIIMIVDGKIAEMGTHKELLKLNGRYAQMYYAQAGVYKNNNIANY